MKRQVRRKQQSVESLETRALLSTITVTSLEDNTDEDGAVTLREALIAANEDRSVDGSEAGDRADTIVFAAELAGGTIDLDGGELSVETTVTIDGPSNRITIDAGGDSRIFNIGEVGTTRFYDLRLINGQAEDGGAIHSTAKSLIVRRSRFVSNDATENGGAIYVRALAARPGTLSIKDTWFNSNSAKTGGAVAIQGVPGDVIVESTIESSIFRANSGKGIFVSQNAGEANSPEPGERNSSMLRGSEVVENDSGSEPAFVIRNVIDSEFAENAGAGVLAGVRTLTGSDFEQNTITDTVVELELPRSVNDDAESKVEDTRLEDNTAQRTLATAACLSGEAASFRYSNLEITGNEGSTIETCGAAKISGSTIAENRRWGGLIVAESLVIADSVVRDNRGLISADYLLVEDSVLTGNSESASRSAIKTRGDLVFVRSVFRAGPRTAFESEVGDITVVNSAIVDAGNIFADDGDIRLTNSTYANSREMITDRGSVTLIHATVTGNEAFTGVIRNPGRIVNSIVAENYNSIEEPIALRDADDAEISHSIIDVNVNTSLSETEPGIPDENGNFIGSVSNPIDPRLGTLTSENGEPHTRAVISSSPARDSASPMEDLTKDQIGRSRSVGSAPDMGAFEFDPANRRTPRLTMTTTGNEESDGRTLLRVGVTDIPADGATVSVATVESSEARPATAGEDFIAWSGELTFDENSPATYTIEIPFIDDELPEFSEFIQIDAELLSGDLELVDESITTRIFNDDSSKIITDRDRIVHSEAAGDLTVGFRLNKPVPQAITAEVRAFSTSDADSSDFGSFSTTVEFTGAPDELVEVTIPIFDDDVPEPDEEIRLTLRSKSSLVSGTTTVRVVLRSDESQAFLNGDELLVIGTEEEDSVSITESDGSVSVDLNGVVSTFDSALVSTVNVETADGADSIVVTADRPARIDAGSGPDTIITGDGRDTIFGSEGNDRIHGGDNADSISGGAGGDTIRGGVGGDRIDGGTGQDLLIGGAGRDSIDGRDGDDTLYGGSGDDRLSGNSGYDLIFGHAGSDRISDRRAEIRGGDGADFLTGTLLFGGDGDDYLTAWNKGDPAKLVGGAGDDQLFGDVGNDTLEGQSGDDTLDGDAGDDLLLGGSQSDMIYAGDGNDTLDGGDHVDFLSGGAGADSLSGGRHKDILLAGEGEDTLNGGGAGDLLNASLLNIGNTFFGRRLTTGLVEAWRTQRSMAGRIRTAEEVMDNLYPAWRTEDGSVDVFAEDPSPDWYHIDSDLDQFTLEDDDLVVELTE